MKKTIQKPDGTTEVVEGTAEEIAEYERKLKGEIQVEAPKKQGPGLLTDELQRLFDQAKPWWEQEIYRTYPRLEHAPTCLLVKAQNDWWSIVPPHCTCGLIAYPIPGGTIRYTTTTGTTLEPPKLQ
jgi:hypothetical protein